MFILRVLHPLTGPKGDELVCVFGQLISRWWVMTTDILMEQLVVGTFLGVVILVVVLIKTSLFSCFTRFVCSIGWEVLVGGVMVEFPVLVTFCL